MRMKPQSALSAILNILEHILQKKRKLWVCVEYHMRDAATKMTVVVKSANNIDDRRDQKSEYGIIHGREKSYLKYRHK